MVEQEINQIWDQREQLNFDADKGIKQTIQAVLAQLDAGKLRVAEKSPNGWVVHEWIKKAILLSFRVTPSELIAGGPQGLKSNLGASFWYDKIPSKFAGYTEQDFAKAALRVVPNATVRYSAYIAKNVVLMPCFVNLGAYVDEGSMIDTWSTIGSCAQIGKHVHIAGGAGIGGVLEPLQASPVIIEDHCFIGARSEVAEGVIVREGSVLAMGVFLGKSTKIVHRETGEIFYGEVPPYSVVVPGSLPGKPMANGMAGPSLYCAVIVKQVDAQTRSKTSVNELLRDVS